MAATALSPRPEEGLSSATIRRRLGGTSPNLGDDGLLSPSVGDLTPRLGPHKNDDFHSPDLNDEGTIRRIDGQEREPRRERFFGIPLTPVPEHSFPPPQPCPRPDSLPLSIPIPPSRPCANPPPIIISSPSRTSAAPSRSASAISAASFAKELPRLPTPDLTGINYRQALTAPLSFLKRGPSVSAEPQRTSYLEKLRQWPGEWGWRGRAHDEGPTSGLDRSSSGSSTYSTSTSSSFGSAGVLPRREDLPRRSLKDAYYLRRETRLEEDEEDLLPDHPSGPASSRRRDSILRPTSVALKAPKNRYPTLRSPNLSSQSEESSTLAAILPALQETSVRFTQKFPWAARNGVSGKGVRLSDDGAAVDAMGVSLFEDESGFGVEGLGRWSGFKWVLMASVTTVSLWNNGGVLGLQS